jgi:predicted  nucleic acid-binding Zn-ribbon protein
MNEEKKLKERKAKLENDLAEIEEILEGIDTNNIMSEETIFEMRSAIEDVSAELEQQLEEVLFDLEDFQEEEGMRESEG